MYIHTQKNMFFTDFQYFPCSLSIENVFDFFIGFLRTICSWNIPGTLWEHCENNQSKTDFLPYSFSFNLLQGRSHQVPGTLKSLCLYPCTLLAVETDVDREGDISSDGG